MTMPVSTDRNDHTGNGATAVYAYNFKIISQSDLKITERDTSNVETTKSVPADYTVTGVGASGGGNVTRVAGNLPSNYKLTIRINRDPQQGTDIRNQGIFYPETHEDTFDGLCAVDKTLKEKLNLVVKIKETVTGFTTELPIPLANRYLRFNSSANAIEAVENLDVTANPLTTKGDLITHNGTNSVRRAVGTNGQILTADSAETDGIKWAAANPLTTKGDLITHNGTNSVRRAVGTNGQILTADSAETDGIKWASSGDMVYSDIRFKAGSFTKGTGTGSQAITGVGFTPKHVEFLGDFGAVDQKVWTVGFMNGTVQYAQADSMYYSNYADASSTACIFFKTSTASSIASYVSMDADGFTVTWGTNGIADTKTVYYRAYR